MAEFELIERIRARCGVRRDDVVLGIGDDAALLQPSPGMQLVACADTLNEGVHFPAQTAPDAIGWKALAVNLSDLAAMGGTPAWALLALSLPQADVAFVEALVDGLARLAAQHGVALVGGDTTYGPLSVTVTALGQVPQGLALLRAGAHVGDLVLVTGTLGDAAAALVLLQADVQALPETDAHLQLRQRLDYPQPRLAAGQALRGFASACIDVSDGLLADLGHVCTASRVGAELDLDALPLSAALRSSLPMPQACDLALTGGDDYELCFTIAPVRLDAALAALRETGVNAHVIGRIVEAPGVRVLNGRGVAYELVRSGYEHFA